MALTEAEELELLELENEAALAAQQPVQPSTDTPRGFSLERALLTNEPTSGFAESMVRGIPAQATGALAGALATGPTLGVGSIPAVMGGAALGEGARQTLAQAYAGLSGRPRPTLGEAGKNIAFEGLTAGIGKRLEPALTVGSKYIVSRIPATVEHFIGIPEKLTRYVQSRGTKEVFRPQNLQEGAAIMNVGKAEADLLAARRAAGASIGASEQFALDLGGGVKPIDTNDVANELRAKLFRQGYIDPRTEELARSKEASILGKLLKTLESSPEGAKTSLVTDPLTGSVSPVVSRIPGVEEMNLRQVINAKRFIDENLEFSGKEISSPVEALLNETNARLRDKVRNELGIGQLYDDFGKIADAQKKLAEFIGTRGLSTSEQRAVQTLKTLIVKNPNEVNNIVKILGAGLPGGEDQARTIFNSIAAEEFTKAGKGAPSNIILKKLASIGLLDGRMAQRLVRAGEIGFNPPALSFGSTITGSALADQYINR